MLAFIERRYSCRNYSDRPVEADKLARIVEAARLAPSAHNEQPYHFYVATGEAARAIAAARSFAMNKFIDKATAFIVVTQRASSALVGLAKKVTDQDLTSLDIGIACAYLDLAAQAEGLGCCMLGVFDEKRIQKALNTKQRVRLVLSLGYPANSRKATAKKRRPATELISWCE